MSERGERRGAERESGASSFRIDNQIGAGEPAGGEQPPGLPPSKGGLWSRPGGRPLPRSDATPRRPRRD
ncbi:hypothetical protein ACHAWF_018652 [Thalassiosira exigua]